MLFMFSLISYRGKEVIRTDEHQPRNGFTKRSSQMVIKNKDSFLQSIIHSYPISSYIIYIKSLIDSMSISKLKFGRLLGEYRIGTKAIWLFYEVFHLNDRSELPVMHNQTLFFDLLSQMKSEEFWFQILFSLDSLFYYISTLLHPTILKYYIIFLLRYNRIVITNITCYVLILLYFSYEIYRVHIFIGYSFLFNY